MGPGQVSEDTEVAITLAWGLTDGQKNTTYKQKWNTVPHNYVCWIRSAPFDCGGTTARAFSIDPAAPDVVKRMAAHSARCNEVSKSNGQMMRTIPIAVYGHKVPLDELVFIARNDARLSHPNQTTQECAAAYCIAISHLINNPEDVSGAIRTATSWASREACREVTEWLHEANQDCAQLDCCTYNIGFVKWVFILAFYHLRLKTDFIEGMRHTLSRKGDCDTNAAIVGGLLGAYWGVSRLPKFMLNKLLSYDYEKHGGRQRPDWLSPRYLPMLAQELFSIAPNALD